ncbi:hypothetical protein LAZ67_2000430 [Cordylochernes scorpioides]|uniref:Mos1 transposase HTH domain-containing protein n=1 Tax=Cordylochernes scorpioides TaxID=51811 RepID=A0ABY6K3N9_9ARAC|nr:hypothetical protein LAZ67_2000430 [Cordylochernes scorpioides]
MEELEESSLSDMYRRLLCLDGDLFLLRNASSLGFFLDGSPSSCLVDRCLLLLLLPWLAPLCFLLGGFFFLDADRVASSSSSPFSGRAVDGGLLVVSCFGRSCDSWHSLLTSLSSSTLVETGWKLRVGFDLELSSVEFDWDSSVEFGWELSVGLDWELSVEFGWKLSSVAIDCELSSMMIGWEFMDCIEKQRVCIGFCFKLGKTASESFKILKQAFKEDALSQSRTFEWFARLKAGRISKRK